MTRARIPAFGGIGAWLCIVMPVAFDPPRKRICSAGRHSPRSNNTDRLGGDRSAGGGDHGFPDHQVQRPHGPLAGDLESGLHGPVANLLSFTRYRGQP